MRGPKCGGSGWAKSGWALCLKTHWPTEATGRGLEAFSCYRSPDKLRQEFKVIHDNFGAMVNHRQFMIRVGVDIKCHSHGFIHRSGDLVCEDVLRNELALISQDSRGEHCDPSLLPDNRVAKFPAWRLKS